MCYFEGREYNSDTARVINKFDVYVCDLGDVEKSSVSLGKKRPCVIISSNDIINPKSNKFFIAPIRTEHNTVVTKDSLDKIVNSKREIGRIYIPLEVAPDEYKFIDMSDIRPVSSRDIQSYKFTIINLKTRQKINESIIEYLLSEDEFEEMVRNYIQIKSVNGSLSDNMQNLIVGNIPSEERSFFDNIPEAKIQMGFIANNMRVNTKYKKSKIPEGFEQYAELYRMRKITIKQISEQIGKCQATVSRYLRIYNETKEIA